MKSIISTIILLSALFSTSTIPNDLAPFKIEVKRSGDMVKMKCTTGCNWTDLKFSLKNNQSMVINEFGVYVSDSYHNEPDLSFAFYVFEASDGLKFESISGTAWKELRYGSKPSKLMYLNAWGVSSQKN